MSLENEFVEFAGGGFEASADGVTARDIRGVAFELDPSIDEDDFGFGEGLVVADVVEDRCVCSRSDDRCIRRAGASTCAERVREFRFEFVFEATGFAD